MSVVTETTVLAARTLRRHLRTPTLLVGSFALPLVLMTLMLIMFGEVVAGFAPGDYADRLAPVIVLSTVTFSAGTSGVGFFTDLREGLLDRFRTMPIATVSLLAGRLAGDLVRILAVAMTMTLLAHLAGFRFTQGPLAVLGFFGVVAAFGVMFTTLALMVALVCSSAAVVENVLDAPAILLFFLSSGFVPVAAFPDVLQPVVRANPLSCAGNALLGLASGGPVAGPVLQTLAWVAGVTTVCSFIAVRRYRALSPRR